jgi:hypothetical protein
VRKDTRCRYAYKSFKKFIIVSHNLVMLFSAMIMTKAAYASAFLRRLFSCYHSTQLLLARPSLDLLLLLCGAQKLVVNLFQRLILHARRDARLLFVEHALDSVQDVVELLLVEP